MRENFKNFENFLKTIKSHVKLNLDKKFPA